MRLSKGNLLLIIILVAGLFLRIYKAKELFMYSHDQDLLGWIIKDILVNAHPRLIGQETTTRGVFVGPFFYYLLIPFYLLTKMDPVGGLFYSTTTGILSVFSFYWVFQKIFGQRVGLIAGFVYAISLYTVLTDREVVPTNSAMLWSVWFFYAVYLLLKGEQKKGFLLSGILIALIWHINLALALLVPLIPLALFLSGKRLNLRSLAIGAGLFLFISLPLVAFEIRHNFMQTKSMALAISTTGASEGVGEGMDKLDRVFQLVNINTMRIFLGTARLKSDSLMTGTLVFLFIFLLLRGLVNRKISIIFVAWQAFYIIFFTQNAINPSEYYLNGMNVIWIGIFALWISYLLYKKESRIYAVLLLLVFSFFNLHRFFTLPVNKSGYIERKAVVKFIKEDATAAGYPCLAVSYITKPGFDFGYRYLFWQEGMRVERPISGAPVYSIVFPTDLVGRVDKNFGALGLVLPDYERYNKETIDKSCSGGNSNLTDPMFGYTE